MSQSLLSIKSAYILKEILSNIDYNYVLKLIRYNKKIQNNLGLNLLNFKGRTNSLYLERKIWLKEPLHLGSHFWADCCTFNGVIFSFLFIITYFIISYVTLVKSGFDKCKLNRKYFEIVYAINISLSGYPGHMFFSYLFTYCWILKTNDTDYLELIIKKIILIIIEIINVCFTAAIITEIILSHKMKCKYGLINEYYMLATILYNSIVFFIYTYLYLKEINLNIKIETGKKIILNKFRDIAINDFQLPDNFKELKEVDKRKYILNNINKYEITISDKQKDLITLINVFRKENYIDELQYDKIIKFEDIIIDRFSEIFFKDNVNIFKLSKYNYLLKYPLEEFKQDLIKDKEIL